MVFNKHIHRGKKSKLLLTSLCILFCCGSITYIFCIPPSTQFAIIGYVVPSYTFFLFLLFGFLLTSGMYLFRSKVHGLLISLFVICYLLLRLNGLTHPLFLILLTAIFLSLELMVSYRK